MSILGWKSLYSNREPASLEHSDAAYPRIVEKRHLYGNDSAAGFGRDLRTAPEKYLSRMAVKVGDKIVLVSMSDVLWIQSHGNLVRLHLQNTSYERRTTIKDAYTHLDPERFVRIHRNAIVNLDHVMEFDLPRQGNAFVHLRNGKVLPISGTARVELRRGLLSQSYASTGSGDIQ
ncbi:MAG: LytTR family DNA-binding domain-containing protein [Acidobacteriaceae bacterium]|jgi:DNA-binding LytR/AlgR family response regulator